MTKRTHIIKTLSQYFRVTRNGKKSFEVRLNDRDYRVGDTLKLRESDEQGYFLGRTITCKIGYILNLDVLAGLEDSNYVVLGLEDFIMP